MEKYASTDFLKMPANNTSLFSTAYLAPVEYYMLLAKSENIVLENAEHYQKQSYRNRCQIASANGKIDLCIPVVKSNNELIRDVKISNYVNWQNQHWRSIESAYNSSPFFEYYADDLRPFFENKWLFLWDFNNGLQSKILELLEIEKEVQYTEKFELNVDNSIMDVRNLIHPKKAPIIKLSPYYQVFEQKYGFISNLSIIDLLFNMGNESQLEINKTFKIENINC